MLRFGVLGAGRIGKVHARTIAASGKAKVAYLADAMPKAAEELAAEVGAKVASVEDIIKAKDVDAILIATPTPFHAEQIEAASNAGKAILCEKPVSLSVARIEDCLKTVEKNKSTLMIGFNRRFDPNFASLEKRLRAGAIGSIEMATIISRDPAPPPASYVKSSGGIFRDMMIHDLDLARFLVGEEFVTVQALGAALVDKAIGDEGDCDTAAVQMQTASGKIAVITNSRRASYGYDQRIEVHGSKGMLRAGNIHNTTVEVATAEGFHEDPILHFFTERYGQAYANEVLTFIDAVTSGKPVAPSGHDGLQAQKLADAATECLDVREAGKRELTQMDMDSLKHLAMDGKTAVITGSTQGLGETIAHIFADRGVSQMVITGRNAERGAKVKAALEAKKVKTVFVEADLVRLDDVRKIIAACDAAFGRIDALVNAAALTDRGTIWDTSEARYDELFDANVKAPFFLMQDALHLMKKAKVSGTIVNILSMSGHGGQDFLTAYSTTKGALAVMTKNVAYSVMKYRIRVNGLNIGWMDTPGEDRIMKTYHDADPGWLAKAEAGRPFGRLLKPAEVARACAYLSSEESGLMTGSIIDFDQQVIGAGNSTAEPPDAVW